MNLHHYITFSKYSFQHYPPIYTPSKLEICRRIFCICYFLNAIYMFLLHVHTRICLSVCTWTRVCACVYATTSQVAKSPLDALPNLAKLNLCFEKKSPSILMGHAVAQLVEALRYKSEGRGFDSRWCHWNFSFLGLVLYMNWTLVLWNLGIHNFNIIGDLLLSVLILGCVLHLLDLVVVGRVLRWTLKWKLVP